MVKKIIYLFCFSIISFMAIAVTPRENSTVHYRDIYFEEKFVKDAKDYELLLFADSLSAGNGNALLKLKNNIPAFWAMELKFGASYYWRINAYGKTNNLLFTSETHHFSILQAVFQNFDEIKMDVRINNESKNAKGLICLDYARSIYDRKGQVVWTMPMIDELVREGTQIRDLKLTKDNTLTFLTIPVPAEIDFEGNVL